MVPKPEEINLLTGESATQQIEAEKQTNALDEPVSHWRSRLTLNVMVEDFVFDGSSLPADVHRYMKMVQLGKTVHYLPILFIDQLSNRVKDLMVINRSTTELPLTVSYDKISLGKLRFWIHMQDAVYSLQQFGFSEKDADEVKGIFVDTNLYFLALTFFVAAFHLLFDFLAFKNDISFWKKKRSMIGMSTKAVLWRCFSTVVIFLFLLDEQTSLLVLIPAGIGAVIELWKVKKALKITIRWQGLRPKFQFGAYNDSEKKTEEYDAQAMKYLSYLLYPLCIGGAGYSLLNVKYKSWYSWLINSFVNGVYAFGFLFMLPQLFVNYKMKSVAHLPWKAFTYKAFNTFIDDIFAFIITMPTSHRLACFRDDVVFLVYLYQRWLYPVDKSRVNEYGESYEEKSTVCQMTLDKLPTFQLLFSENMSILTIVIRIQICVSKTTLELKLWCLCHLAMKTEKTRHCVTAESRIIAKLGAMNEDVKKGSWLDSGCGLWTWTLDSACGTVPPSCDKDCALFLHSSSLPYPAVSCSSFPTAVLQEVTFHPLDFFPRRHTTNRLKKTAAAQTGFSNQQSLSSLLCCASVLLEQGLWMLLSCSLGTIRFKTGGKALEEAAHYQHCLLSNPLSFIRRNKIDSKGTFNSGALWLMPAESSDCLHDDLSFYFLHTCKDYLILDFEKLTVNIFTRHYLPVAVSSPRLVCVKQLKARHFIDTQKNTWEKKEETATLSLAAAVLSPSTTAVVIATKQASGRGTGRNLPAAGADADGFRLSANPLPLSMQWQCSISVTASLGSHEAWCYCSPSLGNAIWCLSLLRAKSYWQAGSAELKSGIKFSIMKSSDTKASLEQEVTHYRRRFGFFIHEFDEKKKQQNPKNSVSHFGIFRV
ncbi:hypothetical protein IHE44_0000789 [Lamprotornis superbus]|uniref:Lipid scramblase CLPTM1L n=1 Tax=Lamprotornis superbus TaxID=245042 RepID=A0A835TV83_9PASS|nr:hypothetical protein IHE44_0000789 [Lamprotornis superbus]